MKIKNLYIENEKRLKNLNINFENDEKILDVVVLAGVNGTGKTTVLEVIYDYFENFQNDKNKINIELDLEEENYINQNNISKETYLNNLIKDSIKKEKTPKVIYVPAEINFQKVKFNLLALYKKRFLNKIDSYIIADIPFYIQMRIINTANKESEKKLGNVRDEIIAEINGIFDILDMDTRLIGMSTETTEILPIFTNLSGDKFDINELSSGEKQLFLRTLAIRMLNPENSIILIDEPELSLHPKWQQRIVDVYRKIGENNQIIIATHSPHILGSVRKENIMLLDKDDEGKIVVRTGDELYDSYGQPTDRVLKDIMGLETTRNPKVFKLLEEAGELVDKNEYESEEFKTKYKKLREILGNKDEDLLLMDMDIQIRKKRGLKNVESK
jgi:hypothetical protein